MDQFSFCYFCGGNALEPDHLAKCDGRQGGIEETPRFRETSVLSFYNAVNTGIVKTFQHKVYVALTAMGASTQMETVHRLHGDGFVSDSHSITPRFAEMRDMGIIREAGERPCLITGQTSLIWEAIPLDQYKPMPVKKHRCELCGQIVRRTKRKPAA